MKQIRLEGSCLLTKAAMAVLGFRLYLPGPCSMCWPTDRSARNVSLLVSVQAAPPWTAQCAVHCTTPGGTVLQSRDYLTHVFQKRCVALALPCTTQVARRASEHPPDTVGSVFKSTAFIGCQCLMIEISCTDLSGSTIQV